MSSQKPSESEQLVLYRKWYLHQARLNKALEIERALLNKRIHQQRFEINRLNTLVEKLRKE
jgi:hypothetical protein